MRFSEILSEDYDNAEVAAFGDPEQFPDQWQQFISDCSDSIAACKDTDEFLFRALQTEAPPLFVGSSPTNRPPRDSTLLQQQVYDEVLTRSGAKAIRSNSIFCSSSRLDVSQYGDRVYIIFPKNGAHFTYTKFRDLIKAGKDHKTLQAYIIVMTSKGFPLPKRPLWDMALKDIKGDYRSPARVRAAWKYLVQTFGVTADSNIKYAMEQGLEIMISGDYYAFDFDQFRVPLGKLMKLL